MYDHKIIATLALDPRAPGAGGHTAAMTLLPQVDELRVCCDGFDAFPEWLHRLYQANREKMELWKFSREGAVGDAARFFWADRLPSMSVHVVCSGAIVYPEDYVETMVAHTFELDAPVGVGAYTMPAQAQTVLDFDEHWGAAARLDEIKRVDVLDTATLCYQRGALELHFEHLRWDPNVADYLFARAAIEQGARLYAVPRESDWLHTIPAPGVGCDHTRANQIVRATRW